MCQPRSAGLRRRWEKDGHIGESLTNTGLAELAISPRRDTGAGLLIPRNGHTNPYQCGPRASPARPDPKDPFDERAGLEAKATSAALARVAWSGLRTRRDSGCTTALAAS